MRCKKGDGDKTQSSLGQGGERKKKCKKLIDRGKIIPASEVNATGKIATQMSTFCDPSYDEYDEEIDYQKIRQLLNLQEEIYSSRRIEITLSPNTKFGSRSGTIHYKSRSFPPLSRGLQVCYYII